MFGSGDCGQLGLGEDVECSPKPRLHPFFADKNVSTVAAGGLHTLALGHDPATAASQVFSWGCNDEKALGHDEPEFEVGMVAELSAESLLDADEQIVQVAAGDSISAALTSNGRVFTWGTFRDSTGVLGHSPRYPETSSPRSGSGRRLQTPVDGVVKMASSPMLMASLSSFRIVHIVAGSNHMMALAQDGSLFAWGCGEQGQLGRRISERRKHDSLHPALVSPRLTAPKSFGLGSRQRLYIFRVVCGSNHTILLARISPDDPRTVALSMGLNNFGQLGLGDHVDRITPEPITPTWPQDEYPVAASAGEHHSLIVLSSGRVYSFGRADSGQLGITLPTEDTRFSNVPVCVDAMPGTVRVAAAGGNHCLAVDASDNRLYSWGYGEMHQLGHGPDQIETTPRPVKFNFDGSIVQACAGGQHSVVLCANQQ